MDKTLARFTELDRELVRVARSIKILTKLAWPVRCQRDFMEGWDRGEPAIPKVTYDVPDCGDSVTRLREIQAGAMGEHPVAAYLRDTAQSYIHAALMLENIGKAGMTEHCVAIYGRPGDRLKGSRLTNIEAAHYFIQIADDVSEKFDFHTGDFCVAATTIKEKLERAIEDIFTHHQVAVALDKNLASKAAAGATRVRLRDATCFSPFDYDQLLQHEVMVHTLTALNGREQPNLASMGLGAPRTTATQEGLATFAELVTGVIDLSRLKRIALRIIAVDMALNGADFLEVFRFFLQAGQSRLESYHSSMRIFRGGDPNGGGVAFTKDAVYLQGLLAAHTFFRWAMHNDKLPHIYHLFAGRVTFDDTLALDEYFHNGYIAEAIYLPHWLRNMQCLGAYLAFSLFANRINLEKIDVAKGGFNQVFTEPSDNTKKGGA